MLERIGKRVEVMKWVNKGIGLGWEKVVDHEATFLSFGPDYEEFQSGCGMFTCAVLELDDGQVEMVRADLIKFL